MKFSPASCSMMPCFPRYTLTQNHCSVFRKVSDYSSFILLRYLKTCCLVKFGVFFDIKYIGVNRMVKTPIQAQRKLEASRTLSITLTRNIDLLCTHQSLSYFGTTNPVFDFSRTFISLLVIACIINNAVDEAQLSLVDMKI